MDVIRETDVIIETDVIRETDKTQLPKQAS